MPQAWPSLTDDQLTACVRERLGELERWPFERLAELPTHTGEQLTVGGRPVERWTYRDALGADELQVVVQVGADRAPGSRVGQRFAEGFRCTRHGAPTPIGTPDIDEFM